MPPLRITVPLNDGETPASFGSRLAQANGCDRLRDLALDVGLDFSGVIAGRRDALDRLAELGGCSPDALAAWAAVTVDDRTFLRGEDLGRRNLRRSRVFVCPACLRADLVNTGLDEEVRPWGRAVWQVPALRTCRVHGRELVEIARADGPQLLHDFAVLALPRIGDLEVLEAASERRSPDVLEDYVHARLVRGPAGDLYPDGFPLYAVMRLSENLGTVLEFGRKVRLEDLCDRQLRIAGARGFDTILAGDVGIRGALSKLQATFHEGKADWGPRAMFGRIYEWLAHESDDPVYETVRDLLARQLVETLPVGTEKAVLNRAVTERRVHSLRSAARECGMHPKRLRKILLADGVIGIEDAHKTYDRVLFPADAVAERLAALAETGSMAAAAVHLNAPYIHARLLINAGFIQPTVIGGTEAHSSFGIRRSELDTFLDRLTSAARPGVGGYPIREAAKRANCSAMEIVRLLVDGKLKRVGLDPDSSGYLSVLVDLEELKPFVRGEDHGGLTFIAIARRMHWSRTVVKALVDDGLLPSSIAVNPVNRCPQRIVRKHDLETFNVIFVSLRVLAFEHRIKPGALKAKLKELGVEPDPAFNDVPATFYRRSDLVGAFPAG